MEEIAKTGSRIAAKRKEKKLTQQQLAGLLGISFQAVSKWENEMSIPDVSLLPALAAILETSIDYLLGFQPEKKKITPYEERYQTEGYYWGTKPNDMCFDVLKRFYPEKPCRLLEIGCGEGRDAVFFAQNGYDVTAFDAAESGLEKAQKLAEARGVCVKFFKADLREYRLSENYDIIYSSGVFHHIRPELQKELISHYKEHTNPGGVHAVNVFVQKPFIPIPPDSDVDDDTFVSGQLLTLYADWYIEDFKEEIFDCKSNSVPHRHCMETLFARKPE